MIEPFTTNKHTASTITPAVVICLHCVWHAVVVLYVSSITLHLFFDHYSPCLNRHGTLMPLSSDGGGGGIAHLLLCLQPKCQARDAWFSWITRVVLGPTLALTSDIGPVSQVSGPLTFYCCPFRR